MKGSITNIVQQKDIQGINNYHKLFHPTYLNNYSIVCVNKSIQLAKLIEKRKSDLGHLNIASYNLCAFCNVIISEMRQTKNVSKEEIENLEQAICLWKNLINSGNSFATYDYAERVINSIAQNNYPFTEKINSNKYLVILNAFKNLPGPTKYFIRLSNYSSKKDLPSYLELLFEFLYRNKQINHVIERIEIAKNDFPIENQSSVRYPQFSVFFNHDYVHHSTDLTVNKMIDFFNKYDLTPKEEFTPEYSLPISKLTTLSQGFKNYKKYLKLLNILDTVYDERTNYAFVSTN